MEARMSSVRRLGLAAVGLALVAAATACSGGGTVVGTNPAATVNGTNISRQQVADRVADYQKFLKAAAAATGSSTSGSTAISQFVAQELPNYEGGPYSVPNVGSADQLTQLITEQIYQDALDAAGGKVTKADRTEAQSQLEQSLTQQGLSIDKMPKPIIDSYVELGAVSTALGKRLQPKAPKALRDAVAKAPARYEARIRAIYDQDPSAFRQVCAFLMGAKTEAEAGALRDRVANGEDFAKVASEGSIIDPAAASTSNCYDAARFIEVFKGTDADLKPGTLLGPATPDTTWLVAKVDTTKTSYEDVADAIRSQVQDTYTPAAQDRIQQWVAEQIDKAAQVRVDPRYGRWNAKDRVVVPNTAIPVVSTTIATAPAGS